jgi:hypothetical protein
LNEYLYRSPRIDIALNLFETASFVNKHRSDDTAFTFFLPFSFPVAASILPVFAGKWSRSLIKGDITVWASYTDCCSEGLKAKTGRKEPEGKACKIGKYKWQEELERN